MKILCIGDSGTRGSVGVSYVKAIAAAHPEWKVENAGVNGEPITSIGKRLIGKLDAGNAYDVIVLQGGGNDILARLFGQKLAQGCLPAAACARTLASWWARSSTMTSTRRWACCGSTP